MLDVRVGKKQVDCLSTADTLLLRREVVVWLLAGDCSGSRRGMDKLKSYIVPPNICVPSPK